MSRGNRLHEAIEKIFQEDFENALVQLAICIDATSKAKYPRESKVGHRVKRYIQENISTIHFLMTSGRVIFNNSVTYGRFGTLDNVIYKTIRCALLHEGDISDNVEYDDGCVVGLNNDKFLVTRYFLWGLVLILVGDEVNRNQSFKSPQTIERGGVNLPLDSLWGRMDEIKRLIGLP